VFELPRADCADRLFKRDCQAGQAYLVTGLITYLNNIVEDLSDERLSSFKKCKRYWLLDKRS
jgi:hypothetical protein